MALKQCKECKKEISSDANPCPHCGKKNPLGMPRWIKYGGGAVLAIGIIGAMAKPRDQTSVDSPAPSAGAAPAGGAAAAVRSVPEPPAASAVKKPDVTVDAMKLWKDYDANEVAADGMYKGKLLRVTGTVASIDKDILDDIVVHLRSPNEFMNTMAKLKSSETSKAAVLSKGASVTLLCKGHGRIVGSPSLRDCTIAE